MILETDTQKPAAPKINAFGKEYVFQGEFDSLEAMNQNAENWKKIGHGTMVKNKNRLYATRFKQ